MTTMEKVINARRRLLIDYPFFGKLSLRLKIIETTKLPFKTMGTNGKDLAYDPTYVENMSKTVKGRKLLITTIAHEVLHVAFMHPFRMRGRNFELWNVACDYAINGILRDAGLELPEGVLYDSRFAKMSAEAIYDVLLDEQRQQQQEEQEQNGEGENDVEENGSSDETDDGDGSGEGDTGDETDSRSSSGSDESEDEDGDNDETEGKDANDGNTGEDDRGSSDVDGVDDGETQGTTGVSEAGDQETGQTNIDPAEFGAVYPPDEDVDLEEAEKEVKGNIAQTVSMGYGNLPGYLKDVVDEILDPKLPWTVLLREFLDTNAANDYSYDIPNPDYMQRGLIVPSLMSDELPDIALVLDSSMSVWGYMDEFCSEASGVLSQFQTTALVMMCDTAIREPKEYSVPQDLPIKWTKTGGGGTSFKPPFDYIEKEGFEPKCLIYFTDLNGRFPEEEPPYPVLWVVPEQYRYDYTGKEKEVPFGEVIVL